MAIGTDALIDFFGTQDALDSTSSAVTDGSFSVAGDLNTWTNDDDAPTAHAVLEFTCSTAPDAGSFIELHLQPLNMVSTSDADVPDANFTPYYAGSFPVNDVTSAQFSPLEFHIPNYKTSSVYQPFIRNQAGQTISAGWDLHITPKTGGPHA